jgi:glutamate-1-semialdehyde 2,1-aminomutase
MSKQHARYGGAVPAVLRGGDGAAVYTPEGRRLVDWNNGLAAVTLGHGYTREALVRAARDGSGSLSLPTTREIEVSERFCQRVWADQVRWVSTGSEATEAAVRIARIATGRDRVLSIGYHSWFAPFTALKPIRPGVPEAFRSVIVEAPYNDLDAAIAVATDSGPLAAIILEPTLETPPADDYLRGLARLAETLHAVLISDEIVCGFRWHERGAMWGTYGLEPDLRCYGKAISNGAAPVACVVGRRDLMQHAWPVSGTNGGHPLALAAVAAVLDVYAAEPVLDRIARSGQWLLDTAARTFQRCDAPLRMTGPPQHPVIRATTGDAERDRFLLSVCTSALAEAGVLWHPGGANPSMAYTSEDLLITEQALIAATRRVADLAELTLLDLIAAVPDPIVPSLLRGPTSA